MTKPTQAQIGQQLPEILQYEAMVSRNKIATERDNATIERCKQVVKERAANTYDATAKAALEHAAAALDKLKDKT